MVVPLASRGRRGHQPIGHSVIEHHLDIGNARCPDRSHRFACVLATITILIIPEAVTHGGIGEEAEVDTLIAVGIIPIGRTFAVEAKGDDGATHRPTNQILATIVVIHFPIISAIGRRAAYPVSGRRQR